MWCGRDVVSRRLGSVQLKCMRLHNTWEQIPWIPIVVAKPYAWRSLKSIYLCSLLPNLMPKLLFTRLAFLAFHPVATSPSLPLSLSPPPLLLQIPKQVSTDWHNLSFPSSFSAVFCPFSCSCSTWEAVINQTSVFPFPDLSPDAVRILLL